MDDLEEAWCFVKRDHLELDDEDDEASQEQKPEFKELTADELGKANTALQAHMLIISEIKKKIEQELFMAEAAATGGWAAVSVLENKSFNNITGASDAEKELKMQRIKEAMKVVKKEQSLNISGNYQINKSLVDRIVKKPRKRIGQLKSFGSKFHGNFGYGGYDDGYDGYDDHNGYGYDVMATPVYGPGGRGGYGQGYGDDGGHGGRGGYGNRGAGGSRGGGRVGRTCHRCIPC